MSDTKQGKDWLKDLESVQRQYWTAWSEMAKKSAQGGGDAGRAVQWHEGLEMWSRAFAPNQAGQSDTMEKLLANAKSYLATMQGFLGNAMNRDGVSMGDAAQWTEALRKTFSGAGIESALSGNPMAQAMRGISADGAKGWEEMMAQFKPFFAQFQGEQFSMQGLPSFGMTRERQEQVKKMSGDWSQFQDALGRYNGLMLTSSKRAFEVFETKLGERSEPGRQLDSVRAVYDLWVDAAEEAYAEVALSAEFRKVYGELVNAQMRVRQALQGEVERSTGGLGMPTRTEMDSVHKRMHELRRAQRDSGAEGLASEVTALRAEVAALRAAVKGSKAAANKPAGSKVKAATKAKAKRAAPTAKQALFKPRKAKGSK